MKLVAGRCMSSSGDKLVFAILSEGEPVVLFDGYGTRISASDFGEFGFLPIALSLNGFRNIELQARCYNIEPYRTKMCSDMRLYPSFACFNDDLDVRLLTYNFCDGDTLFGVFDRFGNHIAPNVFDSNVNIIMYSSRDLNDVPMLSKIQIVDDIALTYQGGY